MPSHDPLAVGRLSTGDLRLTLLGTAGDTSVLRRLFLLLTRLPSHGFGDERQYAGTSDVEGGRVTTPHGDSHHSGLWEQVAEMLSFPHPKDAANVFDGRQGDSGSVGLFLGMLSCECSSLHIE